MIKKWLNYRMAAVLFALPLVATAVASAQQWAADSAPITVSAADNTANELNELASARVHTISLNRAGEVEGRIASLNADSQQSNALSDLKVFFVRNGEIAQSTKTLADGTFVIDGLSEGIYSFVATGQTGFAAYGVRVVGFGEVETVNVMEAAAVSPHFSIVKSILEKNLPGDVANEIAAASRNELAEKAVGSNRVVLKDGNLTGQVLPMLGELSVVKGTQVHIIADDKQVAQVEVDDRGSFMVPDLEPGVYDFVAAGPSGFAAVSFQAFGDDVGEIGNSVLADSDEIPVAIPTAAQDAIPADIPFDSGYVDGGMDMGFAGGGYSDSLDVCLTCQQDTGFVGEQIGYAGTEYYDGDITYDSSPIEYASESVGCGCAAGGACGSCGDFSGVSSCNSCAGGRGGVRGGGGLLGLGALGGGLGPLISLGGLAGGIVAIASDTNEAVTPPPASASTTNGDGGTGGDVEVPDPGVIQ